jgi:hypothetical protein
MDERQNASHTKEKSESTKTNIHIHSSITERKPNIHGSGEKENARQRKLHKTE